MDDNQVNAHVQLFHPSGASVSIPLSLEQAMSEAQAARLADSVSILLSAGFMVALPGLAPGEAVEEVCAVSRRAKSDGTPIVAFYVAHPMMVKKFIHHYLDDLAAISEFETGTGLHLGDVPCRDSDKDIEKTHTEAKRYIIPLPAPIKITWAISPRWEKWKADGGEGQEPQKRILLSYGQKPPAHQQPAQGEAPAATSTPIPTQLTKTPLKPVGQGVSYPKLGNELVVQLIASTGKTAKILAPVLAAWPDRTLTLAQAEQWVFDEFARLT